MYNQIICGDAAEVLSRFPVGCVDLTITSPFYWDAVGSGPPKSYDEYLADLLPVWKQVARVTRPNGKVAINSAAMPIPHKRAKLEGIRQHTRHLKDIPSDIAHQILAETDLLLYEVLVWQKQTSIKMMSCFPYPGNVITCNTTERVHIFAKPGKPPKFAKEVKAANVITDLEWRDLTQQTWFMMPADIRRKSGHPSPFPEKLVARLVKLYTMGAAPDFPGELILDPFCGSGTACAVARQMGRRFVGIDINPAYVAMAEERVRNPPATPPLLLCGFPKHPSKAELIEMQQQKQQLGSIGKAAGTRKHKTKRYGMRRTDDVEVIKDRGAF